MVLSLFQGLSYQNDPFYTDCLILLPGDNTEKIWAHRLFAKQKTDVPKARKMAAGGPGRAVALPVGGRH